MDQYTPYEFRQLYGRLSDCIFWGSVVSVTKQNDIVTLICTNNHSITTPIIFHEGTWKMHGIAHSPNGEKYCHLGKLHREDGPASIIRYANGNIRVEMYYWDDKWHRENGPAICLWHENGNIEQMLYYQHGRKHRVDGPQCQVFDVNGHLRIEDWCIDGKLHRIGKPAILEWNSMTNSYDEYWYVNGEKILPPNYIYDVLELPDHWEDAAPEFD